MSANARRTTRLPADPAERAGFLIGYGLVVLAAAAALAIVVGLGLHLAAYVWTSWGPM